MMALFPGTTKLIGIDTNVLLRALLQDDLDQGEAAAAVMRSLTGGVRGLITHVTLVELYWVLSRSRQVPKDGCLDIIRLLVETEALEFEDGEGVVQALALAEDGADFPDALINSSMELLGTDEVVTFDRRASQSLGWTLLGS